MSNLPAGVTDADLSRGTWDDAVWDRFVDTVIERLAERGMDYYQLEMDDEQRVYAAIERHADSLGEDAQRVADAVYDDWCERGCA